MQSEQALRCYACSLAAWKFFSMTSIVGHGPFLSTSIGLSYWAVWAASSPVAIRVLRSMGSQLDWSVLAGMSSCCPSAAGVAVPAFCDTRGQRPVRAAEAQLHLAATLARLDHR